MNDILQALHSKLKEEGYETDLFWRSLNHSTYTIAIEVKTWTIIIDSFEGNALSISWPGIDWPGRTTLYPADPNFFAHLQNIIDQTTNIEPTDQNHTQQARYQRWTCLLRQTNHA